MLSFLALAVLFEVAFVAWADRTAWFRTYLEITAQVASSVLVGLGFSATRVGNVVWLEPHGRVELLRGCDGLESVGLFALAVLLFPAPLRSRLCATLAGASAIVALNLVRVVSLGLAVVYRPGAYATLHEVVWPVIFVLGPLALWSRWTSRRALAS